MLLSLSPYPSSLTPSLFPPISLHGHRHRRKPHLRPSELRCQSSIKTLFNSINSFFGFDSTLLRSMRIPLASDWILFTNPTPFNRSVLLRCPSVSFEEEDEFLKESRHFVKLSRVRVPLMDERDLKFQRVCVRTDDGGVISMDWPDYLDLERENGLDTTVLIVPGTAEGSMDEKVRLFVIEAVEHGCFPIVLNPRGCAGSALTTARLFTAADSDDVCTAVQFVNGIRPWATLMAIGWGYGANMLTKYLIESGERTPVTAAVSIDTPFDLEESTMSPTHQVALNEKMSSGLREILRANKELFQGKTKGFDVAKALSAKSIRDFDEAVSMVSYGFDSLEDFYRTSSTRQLIDSLKIPVLFIQSNDGTVPLFSIPRNSITDNPFTSLLLYSCSHSTIRKGAQSALLWSQQLAIEWLSAVEHTLLKGRHPLLNDVDITIKPSKGPTSEVRELSVSSFASPQLLLKNNYRNIDPLMKHYHSDSGNGFLVYPRNTEFTGDDGAPYDNAIGSRRSGSKFVETERADEVERKNEKHDTIKDPTSEGAENVISSEGGQVTQTATVIMNMLDVTIPGNLNDEQKKKVLGAMERGETFMKALQGAVPEDVRGKITNAVTEIMQSQGTNLNREAVKRIGWIPDVTSELKSKIQGKINGNSTKESGSDDCPLEQRKVDKSSDKGSEVNFGLSQDNSAPPFNGDGSDENFGALQKKGALPSGGFGSEGNFGSSEEKATRSSGSMEDRTSLPSKSDQMDCRINEESAHQYEVIEKSVSFDKNINQTAVHGDMKNENVEEPSQSSISSSTNFEDSSSVDSFGEAKRSQKISLSKQSISDFEDSSFIGSSAHQMSGEVKENQNNDENSAEDGASQNVEVSSKSEEPSPQSSPSNSYSLSVSKAFDALTEFDDSTQMAVNNVFGVIENMINQLEKSNKDGDVKVKEREDQRSTKGFNDSPPINGETYNNFSYIIDGSRAEPGLCRLSTQPEKTFSVGGIEPYEDVKDKLGYSVLNFSPVSSSDMSIKQSEDASEANHLSSTKSRKDGYSMDLTLDVAMKRYWLSPYAPHHYRYFTPFSGQSSLDPETATDLFLDPEEGQWKMIEQPSSAIITAGLNGKDRNVNFASGRRDRAAIEPSYVILDGEHSEFNDLLQEHDDINDNEQGDFIKEKIFFLIKKSLLDNFNVEVHRRIRVPESEELNGPLANDLDKFVNKVSRAVVSYSDLNSKGNVGANLMKFGTVEGEKTVEIILSALQDASLLRKVIPFGVIIGSCLASLRTYLQVVASHDSAKKHISRTVNKQQKSDSYENYMREELSVANKIEKVENDHLVLNKPIRQGYEKFDTVCSTNGCIMAGAVTAAFGASALLANRQNKIHKKDVAEATPDCSIRDLLSDDEFMQEKSQNNFFISFAEKAMSVVGPVVPTKSDGEVDHERLVAILAELGQKGGILRLVGKVALLWGGIRGAMSLTDRLITFLHVAERPLLQRLVGFFCMVLVLWSPVVIPMLPTLVQSWTTHNQNSIANFSCIVSLYIAAMILMILWGKRIRGYDNPIEQYGLDVTSVPRVFDFLKGLVGGVTIVSCIHLVNALLGYVSLAPTGLPSSSSSATVLLRAYGSLLLLTVQGIVSATVISIVEELLFRSWLVEEVAADLGYLHAIMISGIAFALVQRSLLSVPGFLLLSLSLFGIKQKAHGKLAAPIGIRTGLLAANFMIQNGNFLSYRADTPRWLASPDPWYPFDGTIGLTLCAILAIFFFPKLRPVRE